MAEPVRPASPHPVFHDGELDAHRRFGVADEAERMRGVVTARVSIGVRQFIETQPFMFVAVGDGGGARMRCDIVQSMRDAQGERLPVVRVVDTKTLRFALPLAAGLGARIGAAHCDGSGVGLLFVDFLRGIRYRINGRVGLRQLRHPGRAAAARRRRVTGPAPRTMPGARTSRVRAARHPGQYALRGRARRR